MRALILTAVLALCNANKPESQQLSIVDGQGFFAFLNTPRDFGTIQLCKVLFKDDEYQIDIKNEQEEIKTKRGEIIKPYSSTHCGFRILRISTASNGTWNVKMFNEHNSDVSKTFFVKVLPKLQLTLVTNVEKSIGLGTLSCSKIGSQRSCRISNDKDLFFDKCEASVIFRAPSTWYCRTMNWGTMEETIETIYVTIKNETRSNVATIEETNVDFKLACQLPYPKISGCRAEFPDGKNQLFIGNNLHHERYSTAGTDLEKGYCVLSIKKPIEDKEEGIWNIYQLDTSVVQSSLKGCIIHLGNKKDLIQKTLDEETEDVKTIEVIKPSNSENNSVTRVEETLSLTCKAPFTLDQCYLRDPSGKIHFQNEIDFKSSKTLGMCNFRNLPKVPGRWICGLYGSDFEKEIIREFEVIVKPREGEVITDTITAVSGDTIDLLCRSPKAHPITTCAFTDPQSKVYFLSNNFEQVLDSRISYFGQGLQNGHCGLKIRGLSRNEFGKWTCQFTGAQIKSFLTIQIQESPTSIAAIIGASVGLIAILPLLAIGVFLLIRRRKMNRQEMIQDNISMSSRE